MQQRADSGRYDDTDVFHYGGDEDNISGPGPDEDNNMGDDHDAGDVGDANICGAKRRSTDKTLDREPEPAFDRGSRNGTRFKWDDS